MQSERVTWWNREAGGRDVFRMALPLILSMASWAIMNFIDRLFLLWHSPIEMAAALPSGNLLWTAMALPLGIASYANTFVAQYHGANQPRRIGIIVKHGLLFGWLVAPAFLILIPIAPSLFRWMGHDPELARLEAMYFQVNCCGAGAVVLAGAYSSFYMGRGRTAIVMWIDVIASLMNVVLDWLWIFGYAGFPEMGIVGAAAATAVSLWFKVAVYWWLLRREDVRNTFGFNLQTWFDRSLLRRLLGFGTPNGIQLQLEGLAFTVFLVGIGQLGTLPTAATTLAINFNIVAFVPTYGLGIAVSTLVGNYLGANRPDLAMRASWSGLCLGLAYNGLFAVLYLAVPEWFMYLHQLGAVEREEFESIKSLSVVLLRFVAAYCVFDAAQLIFCSVIKGAGDTRFVLWTTVATSGAAIVLGQSGVWWYGGGLMWWWTVLMLWILALAVIYVLRFWQGKWQSMRVIEPSECDAHAPASDPAALELTA